MKPQRYLICLGFLIYFLVPTLSSVLVKAETIEFPEEELSKETVLPKFDRPDVIKNRNVVTAKTIEVAPYLGFNMTEPIYNQMKFGLNAGYHWSEDSAFVVNFAKWASGLNSQYTDQLKQSPNNLDFNRVPKINYSIYGNYEYKIYYGKISITKQGTMNLSTYPILGLGMTAYDNKTYPGLNFGIGQKFYFTKSFGIRFDYKFQYAQQPWPYIPSKLVTTNPTLPTASDFSDKWVISNILDFGVTYAF